MICNICNKYPAVTEVPEMNRYICGLCKIEMHVTFHKRENYTYYPPKYLKKIEVFDDGNQKYEIETNEWFQIGHCDIHPEKIVLINKYSTAFIGSISLWKASTIYI